MAGHHKRKRGARSSSPSPSLAAAAAVVAIALSARGSADLDSVFARGDGTDANARRSHHGGLRRTRAEGAVRRNDKVNLLVKYKDGPAHSRSLGNFESNDGPPNTWQSHTTSISTISEESHIAEVVVDSNEIDFVLDEMMADEDVELVEEDFPMYKYPYHSNRRLTQQQNRTLMEVRQYGTTLTQASAVWALTNDKPNKYPNTPVKVCIVDTGYDGSHEDLPKVGVTSTNAGYGDSLVDGDGHGTHCAGVIGAVGWNGVGIAGVNPDPTKFSFHISKALNDDGVGTASSVLKGIAGCITSGSKVISMSLGGGDSSKIFNELYREAYNNDVLVFAAAGNVGVLQDDYPASYPLVVSVGAVDRRANRADFSNWNGQLEIMGPGEDIVSTFPGNGYGMLSGTSMATPFVAGVAALVWGYFPACSNQQVRNVLASSAKTMAPNARGCNRKTGFGLVQAKDAFDLLDKYGCAAGGENYSPPSAGGVGGCGQPLADLSKLTPRDDLNTASFTTGGSSNGCKRLILKLLTDDYAYETTWSLKRGDNGEEIESGPPEGRNFQDKTEYTGPASGCLETGTYEFSIMDMFGDGLVEPAYYSISLNGVTLARNSDFGREETTSFTISDSPSTGGQEPEPVWISLLFEDFSNGFGKLNDGGSNAVHVDRKFGRSGLVMVKEGTSDFGLASVFSDDISLSNRGFTNFKVVFSFYAAGMEANDRFCLDYRTDKASWRRAKCWTSGVDFEDRKWIDDEAFQFRLDFAADTIAIRFRGFSSENFDRIFIDKISLFGKK